MDVERVAVGPAGPGASSTPVRLVDLADEFGITTGAVLDACDACGIPAHDGGTELRGMGLILVRRALAAAVAPAAAAPAPAQPDGGSADVSGFAAGSAPVPGALFALLVGGGAAPAAGAAGAATTPPGAAAPPTFGPPALSPPPTVAPVDAPPWGVPGGGASTVGSSFTRPSPPPAEARGVPSAVVPTFDTAHGRFGHIGRTPILGCEPFALAAFFVAPVSYVFMALAVFHSIFFMGVAWLLTGGVWWLAEEAEHRLGQRALRGNVAVITAKLMASLVAIGSVVIAYLAVRYWRACAPGRGLVVPSYCKGGGLVN